MLGAGMRYPWSLLKRTGDRPRYAMFPLFLAYAAAVLEQDGFDVRVIDGVPLNVREEEFLARDPGDFSRCDVLRTQRGRYRRYAPPLKKFARDCAGHGGFRRVTRNLPCTGVA